MNVLYKLEELAATLCFVGYMPIFPGTSGSMVTLVGWWFLPAGTLTTQLIFITLSLVFGTIISHRVERRSAKKDPSFIVFDELAGMSIGLILVPKVWWCYLLAFVWFRFFDIVKPWPISATQRVHGGVGIMLDDVVAGLTSLTLTHLIIYCIFSLV